MASWGPPWEAFWPLGTVLGRYWGLLEHLRSHLEPSWAILSHLGAHLGLSWGWLEALLGYVWALFSNFGLSLAVLGPPWVSLEALFGPLGSLVGQFFTILGLPWGPFGSVVCLRGPLETISSRKHRECRCRHVTSFRCFLCKQTQELLRYSSELGRLGILLKTSWTPPGIPEKSWRQFGAC